MDADLFNYFGEIPHYELMKSVARRVSDGRTLGLIKAWLVMSVGEDEGKGGKRRTNRATKERKGPLGAPDLSSDERHLYASFHTRLEAVGLCSTVSRGDPQLHMTQ